MPKTYMHVSNKHIHKTGGAWLTTNGGDVSSGLICDGGTREEGYGSVFKGCDVSLCHGRERQDNRKRNNKPVTKNENKMKNVQSTYTSSGHGT